MTPLGLTHAFTYYQSMGGVQSMLRRHHTSDDQWGINSQILAFFDPLGTPLSRVSGLGFSWRTFTRLGRRRFRAAIQRERKEVMVYHNGWGVPFFADLDQSSRRIMLLHSTWPGVEDYVAGLAGLLDGVLCVSEPLRRLTHERLPEFSTDRVAIVPCPINACPVPSDHQPLKARPLVLGFNARLSYEQKRVDRLPLLLKALEAQKLDYRFELLGEGPQEAWLREQFADNPRIRFHGRLGGDDYWRALAGWDAIIFTSDYEGLPISLLEAMHAGVIPLYPRMDSGGDAYVTQVREDFLHAQEDFGAVARILAELAAMPANAVESLRERARQAVAGHVGKSYQDKFAGFVRQLMEMPRQSASKFGPRPWYPADFCPYGILARVSPRSYTRGSPIIA